MTGIAYLLGGLVAMLLNWLGCGRLEIFAGLVFGGGLMYFQEWWKWNKEKRRLEREFAAMVREYERQQ